MPVRLFIDREHRAVVALVAVIVSFVVVIVGWTWWNRPQVIEPAVAVAAGTPLLAQEAVPASCTSGSAQALNLNSATQAELEELPGVGPVMAARIVTWRTQHGRFSAVGELREIEGIGEKLFRKLSALVTV